MSDSTSNMTESITAYSVPGGLPSSVDLGPSIVFILFVSVFLALGSEPSIELLC